MATSTAMTDGTSAEQRIELAIGGMTCASCATRIEKKLNRMDGVSVATVNYATEKAKVAYAESVSVGDLIATVEATGYTAVLPAPPTPRRRRRKADHGGAVSTRAPRPTRPNGPRTANGVRTLTGPRTPNGAR